jgi:hypothetical protein
MKYMEKLKFSTSCGSLYSLYNGIYTSDEKYDIYDSIRNLSLPAAMTYINGMLKKLKEEGAKDMDVAKFGMSLIENPKSIEGHIDEIKKLSLKVTSFEKQVLYEKELSGSKGGTINLDAYQYLIDLIDKREPYARTIRFLLILLISNKLQPGNILGTNKLSKEKLLSIKTGFVQSYGHFEQLTLTNVDKAIKNLDKWIKEDVDLVQLVTSWKTKKWKPKITVANAGLYASILY